MLACFCKLQTFIVFSYNSCCESVHASCQWVYAVKVGLNVLGRGWLSSMFQRCLCQNFNWTAAAVGHVSWYTLSPLISCHSIITCAFCNISAFSAPLTSTFQPPCPPTCHSLLIVKLHICLSYCRPLPWHDTASTPMCWLWELSSRSLKGGVIPPSVICTVYSLIGLFIAPWQPSQVGAGSVSYH